MFGRKGMMASSTKSLGNTEVAEDVATMSVYTEIISCVMERDNSSMGTASGRSKMQSQDEQLRGSSYRTPWGNDNDEKIIFCWLYDRLEWTLVMFIIAL